jgi:hypothetical protein
VNIDLFSDKISFCLTSSTRVKKKLFGTVQAKALEIGPKISNKTTDVSQSWRFLMATRLRPGIQFLMVQTIRSMMLVHEVIVILNGSRETDDCKYHLASDSVWKQAEQCVNFPVTRIV